VSHCRLSPMCGMSDEVGDKLYGVEGGMLCDGSWAKKTVACLDACFPADAEPARTAAGDYCLHASICICLCDTSMQRCG
jgi:hypothetical protein